MKSTSRSYRFASFEFNPSQRELTQNGQRFVLPTALNKLLFIFVTRPGDLVTREDIADELWEDQTAIDITNGINGAIRRLRKQLAEGCDQANDAEGCDQAHYIDTVVGGGYRFTVPVDEIQAQRVSHLEAEPEKPVVLPAVALAAPQRSGWQVGVSASVLAAVLVVAVVVGWHWVHARDSRRMPAMDVAVQHPRWFPVSYLELEEKLVTQSISPSGGFVAFSRNDGEHGGSSVFVQALHSKDVQRLNSPDALRVDHLAWFADERHILASGVRHFGTNPETRSESWMISIDGTSPSLVMSDAAEMVVSPDGRWLAYTREGGRQLWVADVDGQNTRRLGSGGPGDVFTCVLWSPDSHLIVVDRDSTDPKIDTDATNGALEQLRGQHHWVYESYGVTTGTMLSHKDDLHFDSAVLRSNGTLVYPLPGGAEGAKMAAVKIDLKSGLVQSSPTPVMLPGPMALAYRASSLSASRDGKILSAILERPSVDVYLGELRMGSEGLVVTNQRRLTRNTGTTYPTSWNPDGSALVFDDGDSGPSVIARQGLNDGHLQVLADTRGRAVQGQFTPDGRWILFLHYTGTTSHIESIDRVPAGGGKPEVVYAASTIADFRCSRSSTGSCVVRETIDGREQMYSSLDAVHGKGRQLARYASDPVVLGDWSLAPDGTTVVKASHDPKRPGVFVMKLGSGSAKSFIPVEGFGTVLGATWSVDSEGFFVQAHSDAGYVLLHVDLQGRSNVMLKSADAIWGVPSRDGKRLAFPYRTPLNRNVWAGPLPEVE